MQPHQRHRLTGMIPLIGTLLLLGSTVACCIRLPIHHIPIALGLAAAFLVAGYFIPLVGLRVILFFAPLLGTMSVLKFSGWIPPITLAWLLVFSGWQFSRIRHSENKLPNLSITPVVVIWVSLTLAWAVVPIFRYLRFFPFSGAPLLEFTVNGHEDTNFTAIKNILIALVTFVAGPTLAWGTVALNDSKPPPDIRRSLACSFGCIIGGLYVACIYGLWQSFGHIAVGNAQHFAERGQINATFIHPNALGIYFTLTFPIIISLLFFYKSIATRLTLIPLIPLLIYVLLQSGSRTGVLGIGLSLILILGIAVFTSNQNKPLWMKLGLTAIIPLILLSLAVLLLAFTPLGETRFAQRVAATVSSANETGLAQALFNDRDELWSRAVMVIKEFPLTGMGFGTYYTDVINIMGIGFQEPVYRDNAANFYLQVWAENGIPGLLAAILAFSILLLSWCKKLKSPNRDLFIAISTAGLPVIIILFLTGPHNQAAAVQILFWFLIGALFSKATSDITSAPIQKWRAIYLTITVTVALIFLHFIYISATSLSIRAMQERAKMFLVYGGFYDAEWTGGITWRWTKRETMLILPWDAAKLWANVHCGHPDVSPENPVIFTMYVDEQLAGELVFEAKGTRRIDIDIPKSSAPTIVVTTRVNRTWIPAENDPASSDTRKLGVMIDDYRLPGVTLDEVIVTETVE